jgi:adenylosuccinate lyase
MANAIFEHLSSKLPVSRMQRDLTDSTVLRNLGVPIAHTVLALSSLERGLGKVVINQSKLNEDLNDNWAVISEALQTILRREGYNSPYETLKKFTRTGKKLTRDDIIRFVDSLEGVSDQVKDELKSVTPLNYTGKFPSFS